MTLKVPDYLSVPAEKLGEGTPIAVRVAGDVAALARDMAQAMLAVLKRPAEGNGPPR